MTQLVENDNTATCGDNEANLVKVEIHQAVGLVDSSRQAQLTSAECKTLFKYLGWSEDDLSRLLCLAARDSPKMADDKFTSDELVDWLFGQLVGARKPASIGIIRLDREHVALHGEVGHSESFHYDAHYQVVPGLTSLLCEADSDLPEDVEREFIAAIKAIDEKDVGGITGECASMLRFQSLVQRHTNKPVFMSPLIQLPLVKCAFADDRMVAIFTAGNDIPMLLRKLSMDICAVDLDSSSYMVVGCDGLDGPGLVHRAKQVLAAHKNIGAILLESTELTRFSDDLRASAGVPIFDAMTCCDFFVHGLTNTAERASRKRSQSVNPVLGCIQMDMESQPAICDVANALRNGFSVMFRAVPGLSLETCAEARMTDALEAEFAAAVECLACMGVRCITADQDVFARLEGSARTRTVLPVVFSAFSQLLVLKAAFGEQGKILLLTYSKGRFDDSVGNLCKEYKVDLGNGHCIIEGVEDVEHMANFVNGNQSLLEDVKENVSNHVTRLLETHSNVRAVLMQSVSLAPFSDCVRLGCGLPVFDCLTLCDLFVSAQMA